MKNKWKYLWIMILFVITVIFSNHTYAIESGTIPLTLEVENGNLLSERYEFEMVPLDNKNPMPSISEDNKLKIKLDNATTYYISSMEFNEPGDYVYEVYQIKGNNHQIEYDMSKYYITITVVNLEDMSEFESYITIAKENEEEKYDKISFHNVYHEPIQSIDTSDINLWIYISTIISSIIVIVIVMLFIKRKSKNKIRMD